MEDQIGYAKLIEDAMLNVVRKSIESISKNGFKGNHHFYITFSTNEENVTISENIKKKYPEKMTIVLQNKFWDLTYNYDAFSVKLSFDNKMETLKIPYASLISFTDPSVNFSLHFNALLRDKEAEISVLKQEKEHTEIKENNLINFNDYLNSKKNNDDENS